MPHHQSSLSGAPLPFPESVLQRKRTQIRICHEWQILFSVSPHQSYPTLYPLFSRSCSPLSLMARAAPHSTTPALSKASSFPPLSDAATHFGDIHLRKNFSVFGLGATVGLRGGNVEEGRVLGGSRTRVTCVGSGGGEKWYRKGRKKALTNGRRKELEISVEVLIEEGLPHDDPQLLSIAEMLRLNAPIAVKLAFEGLKRSGYKTRENTIKGVRGFETIELSVLLCNDEFIRKLNKEWRGEDYDIDVLSMSQHIPGIKLPIIQPSSDQSGHFDLFTRQMSSKLSNSTWRS